MAAVGSGSPLPNWPSFTLANSFTFLDDKGPLLFAAYSLSSLVAHKAQWGLALVLRVLGLPEQLEL